MKPILGITMGDPAGIGPEILLKSVKNNRLRSQAQYVVFGDFSYLERLFIRLYKNRALFLKLFVRCNPNEFPKQWGGSRPIPVIDFGTLENTPLYFGVPKKIGGYASGLYIDAAIKAALKNKIDGIVTLPINKEAFWMGNWGKRFPGHTEMLATLSGAKKVALMLVCGALKAIHVTSHIPLKLVSQHLTKKRLKETISLAIQGAQMLGVRRPRVAICGLNPHAGENGVLGKEEQQIISPVIRGFKGNKIKVVGPLPSDTVWPKIIEGDFDIGVAMYHDQGQIPLKMMGFEKITGKTWQVEGVNITVGLPFIRTSVMHGTGYDIAGKNKASDMSFLAAIDSAILIHKNIAI